MIFSDIFRQYINIPTRTEERRNAEMSHWEILPGEAHFFHSLEEMRFWTIEHVKLNKRKSFKKQLLGTESVILSWNCWCIFYSAEQKI